MQKLLFLLAVLCLSIVQAPKASAKGIIIYSNGETLKTLHELPEDAQLDGTHVNLGMRYKCFSLFWMPLWNYGEYQYALVNDAEDTWAELSDEEVQAIAEQYNLELPKTPELPLMSQIGLKPVVIIVIILLIYGLFFSGKEEEEEVNTEEAEPSSN